MTQRLLMRHTVDQLEEMFAAKQRDTDALNALHLELQFRNVPRAKTLLAKVRAAISIGASLTPPAQPELFDPRPPEMLPSSPPTVILPKPPLKPVEQELQLSPMSLDEACKVLRVTAGTPWDQVERARTKIVERSHPDALAALSEDKRAAIRAEAKRANAAYVALSRERSQ
jgi:DnaJ-domain-containing protein 1